MNWKLSHRADPRANALAKRHYSCQTPDSPQFVKPGRCMVLGLAVPGQYEYGAVWVTSWPYPHLVKHDWPDAWDNSLFRNESTVLSSELILEALAVTRWYRTVAAKWMPYGEPSLGVVTMIDPAHVPGYVKRGKEGPELSWGYSYQQLGFEYAGWTDTGKYVVRLPRDRLPEPLSLFAQGKAA
jgi:hypothetical protein